MNKAVRGLLTVVIFFAAIMGGSVSTYGHALQPGYLEIRLITKDVYSAFIKIPVVGEHPLAITAKLPQHCDQPSPGQLAWDGSAFVARWTAHCPGGLQDGVINLEGLEKTSTDVLVRLDLSDAVNQAYRLTPGTPFFTVPSQPNRLELATTYLLFGAEHILAGFDHLLFILALLLLIKRPRRVIAAVTAFTLAHSLTLAAATLGFVAVPGRPVEIVIAISIVFVASEIIRSKRGMPGLTERYPWIVVFAFGLLHGFGFAGALTDIGLPQQSIPVALLFFNVGVEVGQLIFIAVVLLIIALMRRLEGQTPPQRPAWISAMPAYFIGSAAAFWTIERIAGF